MTHAATDEDLMLRTGRGDHAAFGELVRRHHGGLYALLRRRGLDRHGAEDCAQDTFLRLLSAADGYCPRAPFGAFLVRIARNALVDWRRRRRSTNAAPGAGAEASPADEPAVRAGLQPADRLDLAHAVDGLPAKLRVVVELSVRDGYTHAEIARLLGLPHGTVKTRMHWAVRRLREALSDEL